MCLYFTSEHIDMFRYVVIVGALCYALSSVNADIIGMSHLIDLRGPPNSEPIRPRVAEMTFMEQRLDHFNPTNDQKWEMRYYRNDEFFAYGGPILIFVGGQWTISGEFLLDSHVFDMAKELGAQMFYTEHRYYGLSHPTPDLSVQNLRYLSTEQALADLAHFIANVRRLHPEYDQSQVILIGGAYAASIVTWFRQKYPHLASGAWASSGPVLKQFDFVEYNEVVGSAIRHLGGENCYQRLAGAFAQAEQLISDGNFVEFSTLFRTCEEISDDNPFDIMQMFNILLQPLTRVVQDHRAGDITDVCISLLEASGESDIQAYARWFIRRIFGEDVSIDDCIDFSFDNNVQLHRNISWESTAVRRNDRPWFFQTCSEFGWFRTTTGSQFHPFGSSIPMEYFIKFCHDLFGEIFSAEFIQENIRRKNVIYGGMNPDVTNVYFTHGLIDPWRPMGIQSDLNPKSPVDVIPDASHWQDLTSNDPNDSPEMQAVRERATHLVRMWSGLM